MDWLRRIYPRPEHWDEMISRVRQAADVMAAAPGCLAVGCWVSGDHQPSWRRAGGSRSRRLRAGVAAVRTAGAGVDDDEREPRPRQAIPLVPA
jgi:hypothetical protein